MIPSETDRLGAALPGHARGQRNILPGWNPPGRNRVQRGRSRITPDEYEAHRPRRRRDEIGALAGALAVFQQQAADKASIEAEQQRQQAEEAARQQDVAARIRTFEQQIGQALTGLGEASHAMDSSSVEMETIAAESNGQAQAAASA
eukprot:gene46238-62629_t